MIIKTMFHVIYKVYSNTIAVIIQGLQKTLTNKKTKLCARAPFTQVNAHTWIYTSESISSKDSAGCRARFIAMEM